MFKVGDRVIKARPYSDTLYCRHGGEPERLPLGSKGIITEIRRNYEDSSFNIKVAFNSTIESFQCGWWVDCSELNFDDGTPFKEPEEDLEITFRIILKGRWKLKSSTITQEGGETYD